MRGNVETMEEEMNHFATNMKQINQLTTTINDTLDVRRTQISKLSGVNHVITKVNKKNLFVFFLQKSFNL